MRKRSGTSSEQQVPDWVKERDGALDRGGGHGLALDGGELVRVTAKQVRSVMRRTMPTRHAQCWWSAQEAPALGRDSPSEPREFS
jgi:hypothetical protein